MLGEELSKAFAQPIIIENRPGAGGNVGADAVAKAAPDGYALLMTSAGIQSINQFLYKSMPFDPEKAFAPISLVADMPMLVLVRSSTEIKSLQDLIANAKANPGKLNFGSAGIGTTGHLGQALLAHAAGITLSHVPYRGAGPAVNDLVAGHIQGTVDNPPLVLPHIKAGTLTALAVASTKRLPVLAGTFRHSRRGWAAELGGFLVVWRRCACRDIARDHPPTAVGDRPGPAQTDGSQALRGVRHAGERQYARGI